MAEPIHTLFFSKRVAEPIHALVFSKNRAMQLDAFLRSAEMYAPYVKLDVLYTADDDGHQSAYDKMWKPNMFMRHYTGAFEEMFKAWLSYRQPIRVVFHTDDEVFYRSAPRFLVTNGEIVTYRQGRNTTYCQVLSCEQAIPSTFPRWKWREAEHDFAYPLSLNATVYNSADILPLLNFSFNNPTQLEAGLACQHASFGPEWMVAPEHSCTVAMPHNVVSESSNCPRGGNPDWQPDALCEMFLDGWRIDLEAMDFTNIIAAHQEVPLKFKRLEQ